MAVAKLSDLIRMNLEPILGEWVAFAREIASAKQMDMTALAERAMGMLHDIANDLDRKRASQEQAEQSEVLKSSGTQETDAEYHGASRMLEGFDFNEMVSEFHALRTSVTKLWLASNPPSLRFALEELTRFNEAIDQALAESLQRFAHDKDQQTRLFDSILSSSPGLTAIFDVDGRLIYANKAMTDIVNKPLNEIVGKNLFELGYPNAAAIQGQVQQVVLTQQHFTEELTYSPLNGNSHIYAYSLFPVINDNGEVEAVAGLAQDITERRRVETALRKNEERFRMALANSPVAVFEQDRSLRYTSLQQPQLGSPSVQVVGNRDSDFLTPESAAALESIKQAVIDSGIPAREEVRAAFLGGPTKYYDLYVEPRRGSNGDIVGVIGTAVDITERKEEARKLERTAAILQVSQATAKVSGWEIDIGSQTVYWTDEMYRIYELSPDEYTPSVETALQYYVPESRALLAKAVEEAIELGKPFDLELQLVTAMNRPIWVHITSFVTVENGKAVRITGALQDITDRKHAEEELKLAATVYQDSSEAMMVTDENNHIVAVNQAFQEMTGFEPSDVIGKSPSVLKSGHHDALFFKDMWEQLHSTGRYKGEVWNKKKNGEFFAAQLTINTITGKDGMPHRYVGLLSDITEKKKSDDVIWTQANFDALTGLPNRRLFRDHLQQQVKRARRDHTPLALMFLDLDGFKHVNDTLGHDMGDVLLKEAANRLQKCVRDSDLVARLGGDEFTIILTELHETGNIDRIARHILKVLSQPFHLNGDRTHVSASIGITFYPQDATEIEDLLKNADQAMYAAKQEGKNQYHYFTPAMQEAAIARMHLINDLRSALDGNQFEIVYQPIVELSTGTTSKAEALIRWHHPARGLINPIEFISAAEDVGLITSFGNWIFHEAAKQAAFWREKYHPAFQISVNISPVQFKNEGIDPSIWLEHLKNLDLPGQGIVVEITEGLLLDPSDKVKDQLLMLRDAGIEVSLDDFGTGYSSLSYLSEFDIDYIKIDQAFVKNLTAGSNDLALCEAMIVMAHKLGIRVIAEGVEFDRQHELLANCECDFAQGYLFSRPVSAEKFEQLLNVNMENRAR